MKIEVLDSLMGTGKTTAIIKWMEDNPTEKFIYVSPMLSEVEKRIPNALNDSIGFVYPSNKKDNKSQDFLRLLRTGQNISTTHSLFQRMAEDHLQLINEQGYVLVIDEEVNMIECFKCREEDVENLVDQGIIEVKGDCLGKVVLLKEPKNLNATFGELYTHAKNGTLYAATRKGGFFVTQLPVELLQAAKRTIILTYMFEGSILSAFLKMHGMTYSPFTEVRLMRDEVEVKAEIGRLLTVDSTPSVDRFMSKHPESLSAKWYDNANRQDMDDLRNALRSIWRKPGTNKDAILLTCPKDAIERGRKYIGDGQYVRPVEGENWLFCGARATNDYKEKCIMVHAFNRYPNQTVNAYMQDHGFPIDRDKFALAEMLQWLWRGCIREGKPMTVYVLSPRMKKLLLDWLAGCESERLETHMLIEA